MIVPEAYRSRVAVVYILSLFIQIMDTTIVNIAIPTLADEFGVDATDVEWAVIGFALALAAVIPVAGWLGDRFGTRRVFLVAIAGFVVASMLCGAARTLDQLIAARVFQGLFAGLITPIGSAMLFRAYPLEERARASAAVVGVAVIAPAIGPVLGGVIIETLSWRWIFFVNIPVGGAALALGISWLREEIVGVTGGVDWTGLVLSSAGLGLLLVGVSEGPSQGWDSPWVVGALGVGTLSLIALVVVETRIDHPVLALRLFGDRLFRSINLTSFPAYMGFFSLIFLLPIFLQQVGEHSALVTGLTLLGQPIGIIISSQIAGKWLYGRFGPRPMLLVGLAASLVVGLWFVTVDETTHLVAITAVMFLRGLAMGIVFIPIQTATYATISLPDMGRATSLFNTQRQAAVGAGVAVVATVLSALVASVDPPTEGGAPTADRVAAFHAAFGVSAALFALAAAAAWFIVNEDARPTMHPVTVPAATPNR